MQRLILVILFLTGSSILWGQNPIHKDARKHYENAVHIIDNKDFKNNKLNTAIDHLLKATNIDSSYANINYYLGLGFYYQKEYASSDFYFTRYKRQNKLPHPDFYLYDGIVKYKLSDNSTALEYLQNFLNSMAADKDHFKDSLARRHMQLSKQSQTLMSKTLPSKKELFTNINTTEFDEFYPVYTSDRKKILFNRMERDTAGKYFNRIYQYFVEGDTNGPNPRPLPLNNIEGKEFILTAINTSGKKILLVSKDDKDQFDVYESEWMVFEYTAPRKLYSQINSYADDKFATYGHNDSLIYVISNRPGGYGGYDIWKINNTPKIQYESVINLGPVINTEFNENYIATVSNSNIIFFSSEGHLNIGESDVFRTRLEFGQYTRPVNLGYPINTTADENTFYPYPTANMGLSSVKNASWDINTTYLPPKAKKPAYLLLERYLEDANLGKTTVIMPKDE
jgi:hypothetical protein